MGIYLPRVSSNLLDVSKLMPNNTKTTCNVSDNGYRIELITVSGSTIPGSWNRAEIKFNASLIQNIVGKKVYFSADSVSYSNLDAPIGVQMICTCDDGTIKYFLIYPEGLTRKCEIPENTVNITLQLFTNKSSTPLTADNTLVVEGLRLTLSENAPWEPYTTGKVKRMYLPGSNLLDIPDKKQTYLGVTLEVVNGVCRITGTATDKWTLWYLGQYTLTETLFILDRGTYTVTDCVLFSYDGETRNRYVNTFTINEPVRITGVATISYDAGTSLDETHYPMLVKGNTALPWEPYTTGKVKKLYLPRVNLFNNNKATYSNNDSYNVSDNGYRMEATKLAGDEESFGFGGAATHSVAKGLLIISGGGTEAASIWSSNKTLNIATADADTIRIRINTEVASPEMRLNVKYTKSDDSETSSWFTKDISYTTDEAGWAVVTVDLSEAKASDGTVLHTNEYVINELGLYPLGVNTDAAKTGTAYIDYIEVLKKAGSDTDGGNTDEDDSTDLSVLSGYYFTADIENWAFGADEGTWPWLGSGATFWEYGALKRSATAAGVSLWSPTLSNVDASEADQILLRVKVDGATEGSTVIVQVNVADGETSVWKPYSVQLTEDILAEDGYYEVKLDLIGINTGTINQIAITQWYDETEGAEETQTFYMDSCEIWDLIDGDNEGSWAVGDTTYASLAKGYYFQTASDTKKYTTTDFALDNSVVQEIVGKTVYLIADSISSILSDVKANVQMTCTLDDGSRKYFGIYSYNRTATCAIPENATSIRIGLYTNNSNTPLEADNTIVAEGVRLTLIKDAPWESYRSTDVIWSAGNNVTYMVDTNVTYTEEVDCDATCLAPTTFTPTKSGWTFAGWREDTVASDDILADKIMGDDPITLYAVFKQNITLSYDGNGSTSGSVTAQTAPRYYNNGNINNPVFVLVENGYGKTDYMFTGWDLGAVGASVTLSASKTAYAQWVLAVDEFAYTGNIQPFTARITGTYKLDVWGASGGSAIDGDHEHGGLGGHSTGTIDLEQGQTIYIVVGEKGTYSGYANLGVYTYESTGYNGGGSGNNYAGGGGGATHIATTNRGMLADYEEYQSEVLIVAGGGGGNSNGDSQGGSGGGLEGGNPTRTTGEECTGYNGTQTGIGSEVWWDNAGGFGYGGSQDGDYYVAGGGGAGWYGGNASGGYIGGGGGSGYIGGVTNGSTENGIQAGHGKATITLIAVA